MTSKEKLPLYDSKRELVASARAIEKMKKSHSYNEFEDEWKNYLNSIEKSWKKAERACQHLRNQFEPWQGKFKAERKKDPLLRYLRHARNSDQHTIQRTMDTKTPSLTFTVKAGSAFEIDAPVFDENSGTLVFGDHERIQGKKSLPYRIELLSVEDSGQTYEPPNKHKDEIIPWPAPLDVAILGLQYYSNFIERAEVKFFKKLSDS